MKIIFFLTYSIILINLGRAIEYVQTTGGF